jgi:signal transduction histidine kinase
MNRLIQDLSDLASVDGGRLQIDRAIQPLAPLIEECVASFAEDAAAKSIVFDVQLEPDLPAAHADPLRVTQVLSDLIDNAIKHAEGATRIAIHARRAPGAPGRIEVSVADDGSGIAPEDRGKIFDRFWMANRADRKGNGLGLAIARELCQLHQGTLELVPSDRGTTLALTLPAAAPGQAP